MPVDCDRRRVLVTAQEASSKPLLELFGHGPLRDWEALAADSLERARFVLQHQACDVLLVDQSVYRWDDAEGLVWLARQREVPVLLLAAPEAGVVSFALEHGVSHWLPHDLAVEHPMLLAATLAQAAQLTELRRRSRDLGADLLDSRRQVDRLVSLLWRTLPWDARTRWFSQRHMMERLYEEVARTERYGDPLTVMLGEVPVPAGAEPEEVDNWVMDKISQSKRRCDVAGQYGPRGFMLILVRTPQSGGLACCRRFQNVLSQQFASAEGPVTLRTHFGLASYSPLALTSQAILSLAEQNLEAARTAKQELVAAV
jgi:GGDEF domain-containing protein